MQSNMNSFPPASVVETTNGPVEFCEEGAGPAVLCLHGAMGGYDQSLILGRTVGAPGYRYLGVSRPGYLGTTFANRKSAQAQADLLATLLDALQMETAAVMAVSGGGPAALHFALRHPERCRALVLVSTAAVPVANKLPVSFHIMRWLLKIPGVEASMTRKVETRHEQTARRSILDERLFRQTRENEEAWSLLTALQSSTVERMGQRIAGTINDVRLTRTCSYPLERIAAPTLVVHGTADPLVPFEQHGMEFATRIPGAELAALEGGPHTAIFTHREEARSRVTEFLRRTTF